MDTIVYTVILLSSLILATGYIFIWHKHFNANFTMIFTLVPIAETGYIMLSLARSLDGALFAQQIIYIGGTFLPLFMVLCVFDLCKISIPRLTRMLMFVISALLYMSVLTIGHSNIFYSSVKLDRVDGDYVLVKEYGFMHSVYYVFQFVLYAVAIFALIYAWKKKKDAPRKIVLLLLIPDTICIMTYFVLLKGLSVSMDVIPLGYCLAELIYLLIAYRVNLYDVADTAIDSMVRDQSMGYISFDFDLRYLGSDDVARRLIPGLNDLYVDEALGYDAGERKVRHYLESFIKDPKKDTVYSFTYKNKDSSSDSGEQEERYYSVKVNYLYDMSRKRGYIVTFTDDTDNKKYIKLLDRYNDELKEEVDLKTRNIVRMHDNLIMSLAMMVESRDNSTGGHIKRTSEGVRILIDEIRKEGKLELSDEFCKAVIKAAPMHDLGKIAVDDAILRKPGRFTDEEYEQMKKHSSEGARVIHDILLNTDDEQFKIIAENVAHYHHERWDGTGYPDRLKGEQIPLEARIMAIADVYDALVSKRVYKEAYDFEQADSIIVEGMGTHFDPALASAYKNARPRLEEYYRQVQ